MKIRRKVYQKLIYACPSVPPESGGILGGHDGFVDTVYFDSTQTITDQLAYMPNVTFLNIQLERWYKCGIDFMGVFHSHPIDQCNLSSADKVYIQRIMQAMPLEIERLYFPIIYPANGLDVFYARREKDNIIISKEKVCVFL